MALQATSQTITQCDHTPVTTSSDRLGATRSCVGCREGEEQISQFGAAARARPGPGGIEVHRSPERQQGRAARRHADLCFVLGTRGGLGDTASGS